nr:MAG TPA: hypothetical protein [Caudoviricetes sp.]
MLVETPTFCSRAVLKHQLPCLYQSSSVTS